MLWGLVLSFSMVIWVIFGLASYALDLDNTDWTLGTSLAFEYIMDLFQSLSFVAIIGIAKASLFANEAIPGQQPVYHQQPQFVQGSQPPQQQQQQYPYILPPQQHTYQQPQQQQQMYQQQPVFQPQQQQSFANGQQPAEVATGAEKHELKP
jgi:hypothetical protein